MYEKKYPHLFSPIKIGDLTLKNRIVASPTSNPALNMNTYMTKDVASFFEMRAMGGAAVVTIGESIVHTRTGCNSNYRLLLDDPNVIPSLSDFTRTIKQYDCIPSIELAHAGKFANVPNTLRPEGSGEIPYGPVNEVTPDGYEIFEMDEDLIAEIAEAFGKAAEIVKFCGFEMLLVHAGHGWLLGQFISPLYNGRTDRFGGTLENRMRFPMMALDSIRKHVGPGFPIEFRFSGEEFVAGGITIDEGVEIARMVEEKVDLLHVSAGLHEQPSANVITHTSTFVPHGRNVHLAEAVKKVVKKPVACIGGLIDPEMMEEIIATGKADIVAMSRSLIADPFLPQKAREGKDEEIVKCIRCFVCMDTLRGTRNIRCALNPLIGREFEHKFLPSPGPRKKVLVAGGGPAGMEAALTAARRGHEVILCEASNRLGGQVLSERHISFKADLYYFGQQLARQLEEVGVDVRLLSPATRKFAESVKPDVIIAALGAEPIIPKIPGIDGKNVLHLGDLREGDPDFGDTVAILGGGLVGCEMAIHLNRQGKTVTVVEMADDWARDAPRLHKIAMAVELGKGVDLRLNTKGIEITDKGLVCEGGDENATLINLIKADTVFCAVGMRSRSAEALRDIAPQFKIVGDCRVPGQMFEATTGGYWAAMTL
jgi:2,4-dienoyl-CoA reductase-like NADH-dependent reductase (Old Yellow Enzyme family)/thioredoxin reductase